MRYHFHCTDGSGLILDRRGRQMRSDGDLRRRAEAVARRVMTEVIVPSSWSGWLVAVHDENGHQVEVVPFPPEVLARRVPFFPSLAAGRPGHHWLI